MFAVQGLAGSGLVVKASGGGGGAQCAFLVQSDAYSWRCNAMQWEGVVCRKVQLGSDMELLIDFCGTVVSSSTAPANTNGASTKPLREATT